MFSGNITHAGRPFIEVCLDHRLVETVELAMSTGGEMQDQVELANDPRTVLVEAGPIDPSYQIGEGAGIVIRDITGQLQTEQIRKDVVANASHELRTPLSIIDVAVNCTPSNAWPGITPIIVSGIGAMMISGTA